MYKILEAVLSAASHHCGHTSRRVWVVIMLKSQTDTARDAATCDVKTFLLPTDAHNVKKHRVIKTF